MTSKAKENPKSYNNTLAGNISSSLTLNDTDNWFLVNTCIPIIAKYREIFKKSKNFKKSKIFKVFKTFKNPFSFPKSRIV